MKKVLFVVITLLIQTVTWAAGGGGFPLDRAPINPENQASLQRGARLFVNYCMGCHSAEHQRYNRFARDAGVSEELVLENLIFTPGTKIGDLMKITMPMEDAKNWFGAPPPDLTLIARAKGVDYLYTYLRTFYLDESRPYGVNNAVFPMVGMPHVMWDLQGLQEPIYETVDDGHGHESKMLTGFKVVQAGAMEPAQFDKAMADLVNFLAYIAEPIQLERKRLGFWVLLYIVFAFVVFYLLKREYWKDIH